MARDETRQARWSWTQRLRYRRRRLARHVPLLLGLLVLLCMLALRVYDPAPLQQLRLAQFDLYQRLSPRNYDARAKVRVVDIDEASIARLGQWPWPRARHAELVQRLHELGAAAIGFSVLFPEPDRNSPQQILQLLQSGAQTVPAEVQRYLLSLPDPDQQLAEALRQSRVVLGVAGIRGGGQDSCTPRLLKFRKAGWAYTGAGRPAVAALPRFQQLICNLEALHEAAAGVGILSVIPDADGVVRRMPLPTWVDSLPEEPVPGLALELLRVAQSASSTRLRTFGEGSPQVEAVGSGAFDIPTTRTGELWLYQTEPAPARRLSAWEVLQADDALLKRKVQNHLIIIGVSAAGLGSPWATPLNPVADAHSLHAQLLEQLRLGAYLERPDWAMGAELLWLLLLGLVAITLVVGFPAVWSSLMVVGVGLLALGLSWAMFDSQGLLLDAAYPALAVWLVALTVVTGRYVWTELEKKNARAGLSRQLSREQTEEAKAYPETLHLAGELRELSLLFCYIHGFADISRQFPPTKLFGLLNEFLKPVIDTLMEAGGTLGRYTGDTITAFWNAPLRQEDHATLACHAALQTRAQLRQLNAEIFRPRFDARIQLGIGLHTSHCCIGNLGPIRYSSYSAIGDAIHQVRRLGEHTERYPVPIIVGQRTVDLAGGCRFLELGRDSTGKFHTLLDAAMLDAEPFERLRQLHERALYSCRERDWDTARELMTVCRERAPEMLRPLYSAWLDRVDNCQQHEPDADWDSPGRTV